MESLQKLEEAVTRLSDEYEKLRKRNLELEQIVEDIKSRGTSAKSKVLEGRIEKLQQDRELVRGKVKEMISRLKRSAETA